MIVPRELRTGLVSVPGEVVVRATADGLLLSPVSEDAVVEMAEDGLPVARVGRRITLDETVVSIRRERDGL